VQARWEHLNRNQNHLTRIQTFLLDTHFSIEQTGRFEAGYFINFCGTAGIWRKACIEEAGGWDGSVLSEDLDLSYRAQLKGWKLIYDQDIKCPPSCRP
jgi:cellulose synthase/poly-beta-1,6-N-acetylglucosamine synthase-like glycosyltransferase